MEQTFIFLSLGLIIGGVLVFLYIKSKAAAGISKLKTELEILQEQNASLKQEQQSNQVQLEKLSLSNSRMSTQLEHLKEQLFKSEENLQKKDQKIENLEQQERKSQSLIADFRAEIKVSNEKLVSQKKEVEALQKSFQNEFKTIANSILEKNTKDFSEVHQRELSQILQPFGKEIKEFKKTVTDVYTEEGKQRHSLERQIKELAQQSAQISQEAINLTKALKGDSKTQGLWGEMILENILEKSGLRKNEEYFMEAQLFDKDGTALRSELKNKKMRPDALVKYPGDRDVIIDSKVSLNDFVKASETSDKEEQEVFLKQHVNSVKNHITSLSAKGYEDYGKSMDFVIMFIPNEPAYIAAMQQDPSLWEFAYSKRILLMNPTNLITALKLIVDLWKRENQNLNAIKIAERGELMYKKFVGFIENMQSIGENLEKANKSYTDAFKQLSTGPGNLVGQSQELKKLANLSPKKDISEALQESAALDKLSQSN